MELKKLVLLCQHKLHTKPTTSLCSVIQRCQVHQIFAFYVFSCNLKENYHIRRNINSKKEMFICEIIIIIIIILICQKLGSVGLVQQKIKLPLPKPYYVENKLYLTRFDKYTLNLLFV